MICSAFDWDAAGICLTIACWVTTHSAILNPSVHASNGRAFVIHCILAAALLGYSYDTLQLQLRYAPATVKIRSSYSYDTLQLQLRYAPATVKIRSSYSYDTLQLQLRYAPATVTIHSSYS